MNSYKLIALDGIQNPQNLGMIIRSCAVKASAGTLFKLPIYYCNSLDEVFGDLGDAKIYSMDAKAEKDIYSIDASDKVIFVLGNESDGLSNEVQKLCNDSISIPMNRGVESLNVAVTASLLAFIK